MSPLIKWKGDGLINQNAAGQTLNLKVRQNKPKKFYFAIDNIGAFTEDIETGLKFSRRVMRPKIFSLTGGRQNVTSLFRKSRYSTGDLRPGLTREFECSVKFKRGARATRKKLKFVGKSSDAPVLEDTIRVNVQKKE